VTFEPAGSPKPETAQRSGRRKHCRYAAPIPCGSDGRAHQVDFDDFAVLQCRSQPSPCAKQTSRRTTVVHAAFDTSSQKCRKEAMRCLACRGVLAAAAGTLICPTVLLLFVSYLFWCRSLLSASVTQLQVVALLVPRPKRRKKSERAAWCASADRSIHRSRRKQRQVEIENSRVDANE
jgi:hypothetical protein